MRLILILLLATAAMAHDPNDPNNPCKPGCLVNHHPDGNWDHLVIPADTSYTIPDPVSAEVQVGDTVRLTVNGITCKSMFVYYGWTDEGADVFRYIIDKKIPRFKVCKMESVTAIKVKGYWYTLGSQAKKARTR